MDGPGWTEERHASFLNWLEDCFVRRMLRLPAPPSAAAAAAAADEGSDSGAAKNGRTSPLGTVPGSGDTSVARHGRARKRRQHRCDAPLDQVVPQLGSIIPDISDENERKEEEGGTLTSVAPTIAGRKRRKR